MAGETKVIDEWSDAVGLRWRVVEHAGFAGTELQIPGRDGEWDSVSGVHPDLAHRLAALLAERRQESEPEGGR